VTRKEFVTCHLKKLQGWLIADYIDSYSEGRVNPNCCRFDKAQALSVPYTNFKIRFAIDSFGKLRKKGIVVYAGLHEAPASIFHHDVHELPAPTTQVSSLCTWSLLRRSAARSRLVSPRPLAALLTRSISRTRANAPYSSRMLLRSPPIHDADLARFGSGLNAPGKNIELTDLLPEIAEQSSKLLRRCPPACGPRVDEQVKEGKCLRLADFNVGRLSELDSAKF
jgi:hypothetical protein